MELYALSRKVAEEHMPTVEGPAIAICIAYPEGRLHRVNAGGGLLGVHHTRFSDCDGKGVWCFPGNKGGNVAVPMTRGQAIDILDFVNKYKDDVTAIYAACYGGVSRSAGVLAGLAAIYGWSDKRLYDAHQPNAWVKSLLMQEYKGGKWFQ